MKASDMKLFKTDGTIDENAAGEYAYTVMNPAVVTGWARLVDTAKDGWRATGAAIAARVRQELNDSYQTRKAEALEAFAQTVFGDCHPDCKTTIIETTRPNYRGSLIAAVNAMADKIESQRKYIGEQGQRIKDCRADEIEALRETVRSMESQLAACRTALQEQTNKAGKLEKTSSLWCERFLEATKANTEIGMMLVEMMVRHGVEPPENEQEAVAASETQATESQDKDDDYFRRTCKACSGTGWNGGATRPSDAVECGQCCGRGAVYVRRSDDRK